MNRVLAGMIGRCFRVKQRVEMSGGRKKPKFLRSLTCDLLPTYQETKAGTGSRRMSDVDIFLYTFHILSIVQNSLIWLRKQLHK